MSDAWTVHWLEAEGSLSDWRTPLAAEVEVAQSALASLMPPPTLDILVQRLAGNVIPELGMVGYSHRKTLFSLTVDPDNPNFEKAVLEGAVSRHVLHEAHHCLRMAGPGYGRTLGEALVSEGLAGHFVHRLLGTPPELWERAVDETVVTGLYPSRDELAASNYDHRAWFFGAGGRYPRWLGYTMGYVLVGRWLAKAGSVDARTWIEVPASVVLDAALPEPHGR